MSLLTLTTLMLIGYGVVTRRWMGPLALGAATPAGAAFVAGSVIVPTFYAVGIGALLSLALDALWRLRTRLRATPSFSEIPGLLPLLLFFAWAVSVTLLAPLIFDGEPLYLPYVRLLSAGTVTVSNIAQITYLLIGIAIVIVLARSRSTRPSGLGLAVGTVIVLSFWRYLSQIAGLPFPAGVFDNSPAYNYIEVAPGGVQRFRGILPEPAAYSVVALVAIAYFTFRAFQAKGMRRWGCLAIVAAAILMGSVSTSTTFVIAGVGFAVVVIITQLLGFFSQRMRVGVGVGLMACALVVVAALLLPLITAAVGATVDDKVGTSSYHDRNAIDDGMIKNLIDTAGVGVGLGSARGSSFVATQLAGVGVIGVALLAATIFIVIRRSQNARPYRPVLWALIALLVVKTISGPDLADTNGLIFLCIGLLAAAGVQAPDREGSFEQPFAPVAAAAVRISE